MTTVAHRAAASERGFTLVEAMAASVLLALGVGMSLSALSTATGMVVLSRDNDEATRIAEKRMVDLLAGEELFTGTRSGEAGRFTWTETVEETTDERLTLMMNEEGMRESLRIYEVAVDVAWGGEHDARPRSVRLVTLLTVPDREAVDISDIGTGGRSPIPDVK